MNPVDIAWAVTKRVDNEEKWMENYYKGKETRSPGRKSKNKSAADAKKGTVKALWTMTCKAKYGEAGWSMDGRIFFTKVREAVKGAKMGEKDEWGELWEKFWEGEGATGSKSLRDRLQMGMRQQRQRTLVICLGTMMRCLPCGIHRRGKNIK